IQEQIGQNITKGCRKERVALKQELDRRAFAIATTMLRKRLTLPFMKIKTLGYVAGKFEGEGTIVWHLRGGRYESFIYKNKG
ncbi:MAG: hypothetical protein ACUVTD_07095, partial [Nitrososphaerales archaeon]